MRTKSVEDVVARAKTPEECETLARNAAERGHHDIAVAARGKAVGLRAAAERAESQVERECWRAVYAYEEVLFEKNGRRTRANRIRAAAKKNGLIFAVATAVSKRAESSGLALLRELGLSDFTFEAVVARFPSAFPPEAVSAAKVRLASWLK